MARCAVVAWGMCHVIKICTKLLVLGWILKAWWLLGAFLVTAVPSDMVHCVLDIKKICAEPTVEASMFRVDKSSGKLPGGRHASGLGSNHLCNATSHSWLAQCLFWGVEEENASSFVPREVPQQRFLSFAPVMQTVTLHQLSVGCGLFKDRNPAITYSPFWPHTVLSQLTFRAPGSKFLLLYKLTEFSPSGFQGQMLSSPCWFPGMFPSLCLLFSPSCRKLPTAFLSFLNAPMQLLLYI